MWERVWKLMGSVKQIGFDLPAAVSNPPEEAGRHLGGGQPRKLAHLHFYRIPIRGTGFGAMSAGSIGREKPFQEFKAASPQNEAGCFFPPRQ